MLLEIDDDKTVQDLQERFAECFPGLKIEFYEKPHHWGDGNLIQLLIGPSANIGEIRNLHENGLLDIKSWDKAGEVETNFRKNFGLNVQVYYLKSQHWQQTTEKDDLTLKQLCELASHPITHPNV